MHKVYACDRSVALRCVYEDCSRASIHVHFPRFHTLCDTHRLSSRASLQCIGASALLPTCLIDVGSAMTATRSCPTPLDAGPCAEALPLPSPLALVARSSSSANGSELLGAGRVRLAGSRHSFGGTTPSPRDAPVCDGGNKTRRRSLRPALTATRQASQVRGSLRPLRHQLPGNQSSEPRAVASQNRARLEALVIFNITRHHR